MKRIVFIIILSLEVFIVKAQLIVNCDSSIAAVYERHKQSKYSINGQKTSRRNVINVVSKSQSAANEFLLYKKQNKKGLWLCLVPASVLATSAIIFSNNKKLNYIVPCVGIVWFLFNLKGLIELSEAPNHLKKCINLYNIEKCGSFGSATALKTDSTSIIIPSLVSLDGDGIDDYFYVKAEYVYNLKCLIFDRWGNLIYELADINDTWNGQSKNGKIHQGVYLYLFECTDKYGNKIKRQGTFRLTK